MEATPCMKCAESISADATVCPYCGFNPEQTGKYRRKAFNVLGVVCTVSIIGAPLGLCFFGLSHLWKRKYDGAKPTTHSPP